MFLFYIQYEFQRQKPDRNAYMVWLNQKAAWWNSAISYVDEMNT